MVPRQIRVTTSGLGLQRPVPYFATRYIRCYTHMPIHAQHLPLATCFNNDCAAALTLSGYANLACFIESQSPGNQEAH
eukprot:1144908-Pelagomonas_calceolata.AAC.4